MQATIFANRMLKELHDAPEWMDSTQFGALAEDLLREYYDVGPDRLKEEKEFSNRFAMERLPKIRAAIEGAEDPLFTALQYAVMGNYIDFSALQGEVSFEKLDKMLDEALQMDLDRQIYDDLCAELKTAKELLYLTDNAGEIGFDRIFAEMLHKAYPHVNITFCVRGIPVANDATRAEEFGRMEREFRANEREINMMIQERQIAATAPAEQRNPDAILREILRGVRNGRHDREVTLATEINNSGAIQQLQHGISIHGDCGR